MITQPTSESFRAQHYQINADHARTNDGGNWNNRLPQTTRVYKNENIYTNN